jgi:hypothetical protein
VTLILGGIGAVVGAVLGALLISVLFVIHGPVHQPRALVEPLGIATAFGAVLGSVLAPVAAWTLMRHVPLWRAILETALGTLLGVGFGLLVGARLDRSILLGLVGFAAAAIRLRLTHRGAKRSASSA